MADFWLKAGDLVPSITATLKDADGNPIDIEAASVMFVMTLIDETQPTVEAEATNLQSDPTTNVGEVRYDWVEGDTDIAGGYRGEWRVEFIDGVGTMPNSHYSTIAILDALGGGS